MATGMILVLGLVAASTAIVVNLAQASAGARMHECPGQIIAFLPADDPAARDAITQHAGRVTAFAAIVARVTGANVEVRPTDSSRNGPGPVRDARAHAIAVVTNGTGQGPDTVAARTVVSSPSARSRVLNELAERLREWDSVVLDFEKLSPDERQDYVHFVRDLKAAVAKPMTVAVPAFTGSPDDQAYDIAALAQAADQIIWMAYDQHYARSEPGPVAGYPWVLKSVDVALTRIPSSKLVLGLPTYGYHWDTAGSGRDITFREGQQLANAPSAIARFDPVQEEQHVALPDGGQAWYSTARSARVRAQIAVDKGLCGVALWRAGLEDPATLSSLPFPAPPH